MSASTREGLRRMSLAVRRLNALGKEKRKGGYDGWGKKKKGGGSSARLPGEGGSGGTTLEKRLQRVGGGRIAASREWLAEICSEEKNAYSSWRRASDKGRGVLGGYLHAEQCP